MFPTIRITFKELDNDYPETLPRCAECQSQSRRCLTFTIARVYMNKPFTHLSPLQFLIQPAQL